MREWELAYVIKNSLGAFGPIGSHRHRHRILPPAHHLAREARFDGVGDQADDARCAGEIEADN